MANKLKQLQSNLENIAQKYNLAKLNIAVSWTAITFGLVGSSLILFVPYDYVYHAAILLFALVMFIVGALASFLTVKAKGRQPERTRIALWSAGWTAFALFTLPVVLNAITAVLS